LFVFGTLWLLRSTFFFYAVCALVFLSVFFCEEGKQHEEKKKSVVPALIKQLR
jgi:hypothetical protein